MPPGAATCPECGAPVKDASTADTEAAVYPELARANLARMRGDYKQAEDQLLSVLKRYPNNPSANEMLGDLASEREDYVHAVEWYEMALEIVPSSASIARKVKDARAKIDKKDAEDTTVQLGLPDPSSRTPLIVGGLIAVLLVCVAGAYFLGARGSTPAKPTPVVKLDAQAPPQTSGGEPRTNEEGGTPNGNSGITSVGEEQQLMQTLASKAADGSAVLGVANDPRAGTMTVTFAMSGKDDRALAARLARDAFAALSGFNTLTLRGVSEGKVVYMADSDRGRVTQTQAPDWATQHPNEPDAWIAYVLQNEWPSAPPATTTQPSTDTTGTATTGTSTPPDATTTTGGQ